jgi:HSP20 family protein
MDRLFNEMWSRPAGMMPRSLFGEMGAMTAGAPRVDVYETEAEYVVKADVPGVTKDDLDVTVHEDVLMLKGETKHDEEINEEGYVRRERRYGRFERSIPLPGGVKPDDVKASFKDGVLEVRLPKTEPSEPAGTKIDIE